MSYIDAFLDRKNDKIHIAEKVGDQRRLITVPANYVFYYEDPSGQHRSIYGHSLHKYSTSSSHKFRAELHTQRSKNRRIFESDINPVFRCLADRYMNAPLPVLNIGFVDIEADWHPDKGYALPENPFNAITAISLYRTADQTLFSWVLKPPTIDLQAAQAIGAAFTHTYVFDDEKTLLEAFLEAIEPTDVLAGWNSSGYDLPYLINRTKRIVNAAAINRFCLWNQTPSKRDYINKFGKPVSTYDLVGRVHLDYMELYAKHVTQQRLSYALNAIGEIEVGDVKTPYDGTLDDLYKKDLYKFIEYNRQDVMLMVKIDDKNKFIDLANQVAHANCVLLKTTMGSVALIEQAIINEMHAVNRIIMDRKPRDDAKAVDEIDDDFINDVDGDDDEEAAHSPVVGAYVAQPKKGIHSHIGAVDFKSLYPSAIRALNMSPETLVGQIQLDETKRFIEQRAAELSATQKAEAWEGVFCVLEVQHMYDQDDTEINVDFFDHLADTVRTQPMTGKQLHAFVFDPANHVCITANGTLFRTDQEGIIPALLGKWYSEREVMQATAKSYITMVAGVEVDNELAALLMDEMHV